MSVNEHKLDGLVDDDGPVSLPPWDVERAPGRHDDRQTRESLRAASYAARARANAALNAVEMATVYGRALPPGSASRAEHLNAQAARLEAAVDGLSTTYGRPDDEPTWTPPPVAAVVPRGPRTEPPPDVLAEVRERLRAVRPAEPEPEPPSTPTPTAAEPETPTPETETPSKPGGEA